MLEHMARYAAIDIGSNSIRMLAAEVSPAGESQVLASERQVTRLGESVFRYGRISEDAMALVTGELARLAQIYQKLDIHGVRAVATAAVRDASNQAEFIQRASFAIGAPVEVISGQEEARLIHLGVSTRWPHPDKRVLIVDVGGGSAEIIFARGNRLEKAVSKPLGAVRLKEVFLKSEPPTPLELHQLREFIDEKLTASSESLGQAEPDRLIATSASAAAVVCAINRIPRARRDEADRLRATLPQMRRLYTELSTSDLAQRRKVIGLGPRRAEIIVPGTLVFLRALEIFGATSLYYSAAGVRDGIIADLAARGVGRELSQLTREQRKMVEDMTRRYGVDVKHGRHVAQMSHSLFQSFEPLHRLQPACGKLLEAAAYLHDIGHFVSDTAHHKHSAYLVVNSDMPGFTAEERRTIALLCRFHRKAMPGARHDALQALQPESKRAVLLLTPLLRLADSLDRSHDQRVSSVECLLRDVQIVLQLESDQDTDLEQWAVGRVADVVQQTYGRQVVMTRARK